jgi:hypothetical protein
MIDIRIAAFRIDGQIYEQTAVRLQQEIRYGASFSSASIDTLDKALIALLHQRHRDFKTITVEIESDGVIETAEDLRVFEYDSYHVSETGIRQFKCSHGKPITTRESKP